VAGKKGYRPSRHNAWLHKMRMEQTELVHSNGYKPAPPAGGIGEPEGVFTVQLAPILLEFKEGWLRTRAQSEVPRNKGKSTITVFGELIDRSLIDESMDILGPWQYLREKTGISERMILRITRVESTFTSLSVVDKLLQAMNLTHYMHNGRITVVPNPRWSLQKYVKYMEGRGCI
jgi:hypothetical protein